MTLKTQWLNGEQTKKLLRITDSTLKSLRRTNDLISITLEGKIHYRLDTLLEYAKVGTAATYTASEVVQEVEIKTGRKTVEAPVETKVEPVSPEHTTLKFINHASKVWDGVVTEENLPCFTSRKKDGTYVLKTSLHVTLVNVDLYKTDKTGGTRLKIQLTFRSVKNPAVALVLQMYPLIYYPGKVIQTFLEDFEAGKEILFENSISKGKQRYTVSRIVDGEHVCISEWQESDSFEASLSEKETFVLATKAKQALADAGRIEEIYNPKSDKSYVKAISLSSQLEINSLTDDTF